MGAVLDLNPKLAQIKEARERKKRDGDMQRHTSGVLFVGDTSTFGSGFMTTFVLDPECD